MCDIGSGKEVTYTAGIPKEYKAANQKVLNMLLAGTANGATPYRGQLSANTNQLSNQSASIMSNLMHGVPYNGSSAPRGSYLPNSTDSILAHDATPKQQDPYSSIYNYVISQNRRG